MKINWPLIGILAGAAVTLTLVLVIVFSPPTFVGPEVPTSTTTYEGSAIVATLVRHDDGCFFVSIDGSESYAIWPEGFVRDGEAVVAPDGIRYNDGDTLDATAQTGTFDAMIGDNEYLDRVATSCNASDVTALTAVG